eukprot:CAMPEP_0194751502 /NCGR_PEP_ID=MMETSP0323_2-20130528/5543_1 /TAXON_ID=2866 ORGANISM="Crypthecodinium cohnii, Strain Seligo" /NCGR_SAMPLE_ID=MMETSP0323_2 /ASSEMBLY_ACC=CAM_ASM_000346 /LENGTH=64 /DNA_ID=CAMNT_0039668031 /DNA_START=463 /DNA_END=657 /DNA_ORIENTATION=-
MSDEIFLDAGTEHGDQTFQEKADHTCPEDGGRRKSRAKQPMYYGDRALDMHMDFAVEDGPCIDS